MLEANIFKTIAIQAPAFALIGVLLYILIKYLMRILDSREKRLDEVTDSFGKVVTNHLHEAKEQSEKLISAIDSMDKSVKENTEFTRRASDYFSRVK